MATAEYFTVPHLDRNVLARIFRDITIGGPHGCWLWNGSRDKDGYGQVSLKRLFGNTVKTHRLMFAWLVTPVPKGFAASIPVLDHIVCDNTSCCNPAHLRLVSQIENLRRTNAVSSINRSKTHCPRGHILGPMRYFPNTPPFRVCGPCLAEDKRRRRALMTPEQRAAALAKRREAYARLRHARQSLSSNRVVPPAEWGELLDEP
jgi:hypothetical protein